MSHDNNYLTALRMAVLAATSSTESARDLVDDYSPDFLSQALSAQTHEHVSGLKLLLTYQPQDATLGSGDRAKLLKSVLDCFTQIGSPVADILMQNKLPRKNELLWLISDGTNDKFTTTIIDHVGGKLFCDMIEDLFQYVDEAVLNPALYHLQERLENMEPEAMSPDTAHVLEYLHELNLQPPPPEVAPQSILLTGWLLSVAALRFTWGLIVKGYELGASAGASVCEWGKNTAAGIKERRAANRVSGEIVEPSEPPMLPAPKHDQNNPRPPGS